MRQWRVEVFSRPGVPDVQGNSVLEDIRELGITSIEAVQSARVFLIEADFDKDFARRVGTELLADPDIDGALVGGASLDPDQFDRIIRSVPLQ